jgi:hypothetical protein
MPQNKRVRLKVATAACDTTLYTIIEGARQGGIVFQCLCLSILGTNNVSIMPSASTGGMTWANKVVPSDPKEDKIVYFVDMDSTIFSYWLDYLRTGDEPDVPAHMLARFVRETERAGLTKLASDVRKLLEAAELAKQLKQQLMEQELQMQQTQQTQSFCAIDPRNFGTIVTEMGRNLSNPVIQQEGCRRLSVSNAGGTAGALEAILEAMRKYPDVVLVQQHGCRALQNSSGGLYTYTRTPLDTHYITNDYEVKTIKAILKAMKEHPTQAEVQASAWHMLTKLACCGGIEAILKAMTEHPTQAEVQKQACFALANSTNGMNLHKNPDNGVKITTLGGIEAILKAIKEHPTKAEVQASALNVLRHLAHCGGIEAILKVMKEHPTQAVLQKEACSALARTAAHSADNQAKVVALGGIAAILKAMTEHPTLA